MFPPIRLDLKMVLKILLIRKSSFSSKLKISNFIIKQFKISKNGKKRGEIVICSNKVKVDS